MNSWPKTHYPAALAALQWAAVCGSLGMLTLGGILCLICL